MRYTLMGYSALDEFALMLNHVSGPFPNRRGCLSRIAEAELRTTAEAFAPVPNPRLRLCRAYCL